MHKLNNVSEIISSKESFFRTHAAMLYKNRVVAVASNGD